MKYNNRKMLLKIKVTHSDIRVLHLFFFTEEETNKFKIDSNDLDTRVLVQAWLPELEKLVNKGILQKEIISWKKRIIEFSLTKVGKIVLRESDLRW